MSVCISFGWYDMTYLFSKPKVLHFHTNNYKHERSNNNSNLKFDNYKVKLS